MNELTKPSFGYSLVPAHNRQADDIMRSCLSFTVSGAPDGWLMRVPTPEERRALSERERNVASYIKHDRKKIGAAVSAMLLGFTKYHQINGTEQSKRQFQDIVMNYVQELNGIPTFACEQACVKIRTG